MARVKLENARKTFGDVNVIRGVDLDIADGEFTVFVGPSGCGKSTLLRLIAGLETLSSGTIHIDDEDVTDRAAVDRGIAMVFQSYALYPHMTVRDNMGFGLRMNNVDPAVIAEKVAAASKSLQLDALLDRKPAQLSGGQRQRVAIGRSIVRDPKVFLFDEPLSNLDAELRVDMRLEIAKLHQQLATTMIYVTHDQVEAMTLADRIVVLRAGIIEQVGAPLELYNRPANAFVAGFIGSPKMNFVEATVNAAAADHLVLQTPNGDTLSVRQSGSHLHTGQTVTLGIRPQDLAGDDGDVRFALEVDLVEQLGGSSHLHGSALGVSHFIAERAGAAGASGETTELSLRSENVHLFDGDGLRISAD
ncbi:MAG: sn-glycerol-3-phosphate ABC transporter ATP-binding protein UgpC [Pseudomonadota bacterium]